MDIHKINSTYLWLKLSFTVIVLTSLLCMMVLIPPDEITALIPCGISYIALLCILNKRLGESGVSWFWLTVTICIPVLGLLISFNSMQKADTAANKKYATSL